MVGHDFVEQAKRVNLQSVGAVMTFYFSIEQSLFLKHMRIYKK